jgi:hypothetical protein
MNLSGAIDRIQKLGDLVEKLIKQSNELRERVINVEDNVEAASERVAVVEAKVDRQTELVEALAREGGIDPETVYAEAGLDAPPEELAAERRSEGEDADGGGEGSGEDGSGGA